MTSPITELFGRCDGHRCGAGQHLPGWGESPLPEPGPDPEPDRDTGPESTGGWPAWWPRSRSSRRRVASSRASLSRASDTSSSCWSSRCTVDSSWPQCCRSCNKMPKSAVVWQCAVWQCGGPSEPPQGPQGPQGRGFT